MKNALLFRENEDPILVSADEVLEGKYNPHDEFVDPDYEFRVQFVKGAKNGGGPYFRLYYSYEEYKKKYPDRADRYQIVANMRRFEESQWHNNWKQKFSFFCEIEKCIKNDSTKKWKFADAYYEEAKTCIEFQHSYISFDFEERNKHYSNLSIKTIWLYDLSKANVRADDKGNLQILEDNARGFFRISENPENLSNHFVYIQVKSGKIYRVRNLYRCEISGERKSTIRYFAPEEEYFEDEFIDAVHSNKIGFYTKKAEDKPLVTPTPQVQVNTSRYYQPKPIRKLWRPTYSSMIVKNITDETEIRINRNAQNDMYRNANGCILYTYIDGHNKTQYPLSRSKEYQSIWILISANYKR